jgi:hypothetical protein
MTPTGCSYPPDRTTIPASIDEHRRSLANLDHATRKLLLNGDSTVPLAGDMFQRRWFEIVEEAPSGFGVPVLGQPRPCPICLIELRRRLRIGVGKQVAVPRCRSWAGFPC